MNKRIIGVLLLLSLTITSTFALVEQKDTMIDTANSLAELGIINNHSLDPENYNLNDNVLRQEIAAVARGISNLDKYTICKNIFSDVTGSLPNNWACSNIEPLLDNNIISKNLYFRPEDKITKAESLGMLIKAIGFDYNVDNNNYKTWQEQIVEYSVNKGLIENFTDYNNLATRGWIFNIAYNILKEDENIRKNQSNIYINNEYGFQLTIPEDINNYKVITEKKYNVIRFYVYVSKDYTNTKLEKSVPLFNISFTKTEDWEKDSCVIDRDSGMCDYVDNVIGKNNDYVFLKGSNGDTLDAYINLKGENCEGIENTKCSDLGDKVSEIFDTFKLINN